MKKVLFAASSGGHLEEALALKPLRDKYETVLVTEETEFKVSFWQNRSYLLPQVNRKCIKSILVYIGCFFRIWKILRKEKPDCVISTGAMIAFPVMLLAKLMGIRTVFVECMFNVDTPTLTGKLCYRFVDLLIVQWPEMLRVYPKAVYGGRVF